MHCFKKFYNTNFRSDIINKFFYKSIKKLPKINKIILNFGCKSTDIKILSKNLLAMEFLTNKKGFFKKAKQPNLSLKIKKGNPTGCGVTLKKKFALNIIFMILKETSIKIKKFDKLKFNYNCLSYTIKNPLNFNCLKNYYYIFNNLLSLNITIVITNSKKKETFFFLKYLQLFLKQNK